MVTTARGGSFTLLVLLAGCAASAPYASKIPDVPPAFAGGVIGSAPPRETDWWKAFDDPVLTALVNRALAGNTDVQEAASRIRQARLQERIERGAQGPQINASAQGGTTRLSQNALPSGLAGLFSSGANPSASSGSGLGQPGETFTTYQTGFDATWELDIFGGQRRANEAARARTDAAIWSARDAAIILIAEVANTYEQYQALRRRIALADRMLANQREIQALAQVQSRHGLVRDSDVRREERQVAQNAAQLDELTAQAVVHAHALATLLGLPPNALASELAAGRVDAPGLPNVPPGLPSQLLQRRPDLRAAERQVAADMAEIGVAKADLYPKFSLTGALQLASRSLSSILESDSLQDNFSGRVSVPILDRGRVHANIDLRQAQADQAMLAYRKSVLEALRDVEDALSRLDAHRSRLDRLRAAALAAQDEAESAAVRYTNGLTAASDMLAAQQTWQLAQDAQIQAETDVTQDIVALYKALGGGWSEDSLTSEESTASGRDS